MKKIYDEFVYIPKHGKIKEKVMLARIAVSVFFIMLCMSAMGITAYAYFSSSITSASHTLTAANYSLDITVDNKPLKSDSITLTEGSYTVILEKTGTASTGFCIIETNGKAYHTQQIGADESASGGKRDSLTFNLEVTGNERATVKFTPHWGTSSNYNAYNNNEFYIKDKDSVTVFVSSANNSTNLLTTQDSEAPVTEPSNEEPVADENIELVTEPQNEQTRETKLPDIFTENTEQKTNPTIPAERTESIMEPISTETEMEPNESPSEETNGNVSETTE